MPARRIGGTIGFRTGRNYNRGAQASPMTIALINRPQTTINRLVIPWNASANSFTTTDFNPVSTEGRMSPQDFDRIMNQIQQCPNYRASNPWYLLAIVLPCGIFLGIAGFIYLLLSNIHNHSRSSSAFAIVFPILCFFFCIIGFVLGTTLGYTSIHQKSLRNREKEFKQVLDKVNIDFTDRQIRWQVGQYGSWISIELDYLTRALNQNTPAYTFAPAPVHSFQPSYPGYQPNVDIGFNPNPAGGFDYPQPQNDDYAKAKPDGRFN